MSHFNSRWYLCAQKCPCSLPSLVRRLRKVAFQTVSAFRLTDDVSLFCRPFKENRRRTFPLSGECVSSKRVCIKSHPARRHNGLLQVPVLSTPQNINRLQTFEILYCKGKLVIVQELCESRGGRPGLSVLTSLLVSVDVKNY